MAAPLDLSMLDSALRGALLSLLLMLAWRLWRDRPRLPAAQLGTAFMLGLCVQVVSSQPWLEAHLPCHWQAPLVGISVGNAVLFWVFVKALFDDDFQWRPLYGVVWVSAVLLAGVTCAMSGPGAPLWVLALRVAQRVLPLVCTLLAAIAAARQFRADLVEKRRRLRVFILVSGAIYTVAQVVARWASARGLLSTEAATADMLLLLLMVAVCAAQVLRLGGQDLFPAQAAAPRAVSAVPEPQPLTTATEPIHGDEQHLIQALHVLMNDRHGYREEDLTVASLAFKLSVPEYRLRRVINQRMGHRNFNAYINGWRLQEARMALADPAKRDVPVLTIALEAGFQSIGPFNRAFKADTGMTPTEFRRQLGPTDLADS
jgi:AraC-like DNA-binding protein